MPVGVREREVTNQPAQVVGMLIEAAKTGREAGDVLAQRSWEPHFRQLLAGARQRVERRGRGVRRRIANDPLR